MLYEDVYCRRGQAENHIKSWKTHLAADRTSCTKATANQFRLFLHAGAYWLMWGLRASMPRRSMWRVAQFDTLRLRLVKIAARVVEMKTMIRVHLPTSCPGQEILRFASSAFRASSLETRGVNGPKRQTHPFNPQTSSPRLRPKAGDDAARPQASAVPKNHQNAPPTDAETSRRCIMQASSLSDWGLRLIAANDFGGCGGAGRWVGRRKRLKGPEIGVSWGPVCRAGAPQPCQAGTRANIRLMFQTMVTRLHSPRAPARPRSEN